MAAVDFDGDADLDVVISSSSGMSTFLNDGTGGLGSQTDMGAGSAAPEYLRVADMNGDNNLDIVVGNTYGQAITILTGRGNGTFRAPVVVSVPCGYSVNLQGFGLGDFNEDRRLDVAVASDANVAVLLNSGDAAILGAPTFPTAIAGGNALDCADFSNDGFNDIAQVQYDGDRVTTILGNGDETFAAPSTM